MKLRTTFIAIICLLSSMLTSAYALGSGTSARGNFIFKNGERLDSVRFEMPNNLDREVKVIVDGKKQKFNSDSIDCIILWHEKHPENKYLFKFFYAEIFDIKTGELVGVSDRPVWLCCDEVGDNASYWYAIGRPDFKKGEIRFNYNYYRAHLSLRYVLKKGSEHPCYIPDTTENKKKWAAVYFNDDPEVVRKLEAGEYDFKDWGYKGLDVPKIVTDYNPIK